MPRWISLSNPIFLKLHSIEIISITSEVLRVYELGLPKDLTVYIVRYFLGRRVVDRQQSTVTTWEAELRSILARYANGFLIVGLGD